MGGGVNPLEWILPPVALAHLAVDQGGKVASEAVGGDKLPGVPGSQRVNEDEAAADAQAQQQAALDAQAQAAKQAKDDLDARTETAQEARQSRTRAGGVASQFLGGKRRASQTLTDPGTTLSGSY